jgi:hypothetical protein
VSAFKIIICWIYVGQFFFEKPHFEEIPKQNQTVDLFQPAGHFRQGTINVALLGVPVIPLAGSVGNQPLGLKNMVARIYTTVRF